MTERRKSRFSRLAIVIAAAALLAGCGIGLPDRGPGQIEYADPLAPSAAVAPSASSPHAHG